MTGYFFTANYPYKVIFIHPYHFDEHMHHYYDYCEKIAMHDQRMELITEDETDDPYGDEHNYSGETFEQLYYDNHVIPSRALEE